MRALLTCFVIVFCAVAPDLRAEPATTQSSKESTVVKRGTIRPHIDADGWFQPVDPLEVRVNPQAYVGDMKIAAVAVHGASVKKGDALLKVDDDALKRQIAAAQIELTNANATLAKAKSDIDLGAQADQIALKQQEKELANAKGALKWFDDVDGKQMITAAELGTRTAKAAVEDQSDELDQLKKMYKTEELTNATADIVKKRAVRNLELSTINQGMAEEHEQKVKQFDYDRDRSKLLLTIDQQTNALEQLKATQALSAVTRKSALDTAQATVDKTQKRLDDLKTDLAGFTVTAPFDGVVSFGELSSGAWQNTGPKALRVDEKLNPNQTVMTLFAPGKLRVIAPIEEAQSLWVHRDGKARIVPRSNPAAITDGVCGALPPLASKEGSFDMPVDPANVDPALLPGEKASVQIDLPEVKDVLIVPSSAVQHGRVKIKSDEKEEWRDVVTGFWDDKNIEIKSGLSEGGVLAPEK